MKRKICIFTGTRAEYGLLKPLMKRIKGDKTLELQIIASGMHLSPEFGLTYREIEKDGFIIDEKIEILLSSDTPVGLSKSAGLAMISFSEAYRRLKPDIVVILGDRFETFAAAVSAMMSRIPIAHLHGGEATFGAIDEAIRHSITKMSHLHFTSTEIYRKRVIQLGENPGAVFNVGAIGLDNIKGLNLLSKKILEKKLDFKFNKYNFLVTFHPVTLENNTSKRQFQNLLDALDELKETNLIFTKANADPEGRLINKMINDYVSKNSDRSVSFTSMGQLNYLSTMQFVDGIIGNSSSGIVEAPSFEIGTINIGDRQKGRIKAESIIDCQPAKRNIEDAIKILYSEKFQKNLKKVINPYGDCEASKRIKAILKKHGIKDVLKKSFFDINF
ncbi:MAG: UDP-N-acetylglucosamine 2-epimerase (hydrolyzing) [Candidatus Omnitrophota bacterium]|nr:MAG: UDP-N-acetylglucosamine 2-epimerase (hydrolyzing) [Candidatus Omnitrophota bacterium]